jgi:hypothetical protein
MIRTKCKLISASTLVVVCTLAVLPIVAQNKGNPAGPSNPQSVLVINGPGSPVPTTATVSGTVNLSSGTTVNVGNMPSVNVSNTPSVNVANTPSVNLAAGSGVNVSNPLDSQNNPSPLATLDATQPYEDSCGSSFGGSDRGFCSFQAIPAGKRLVIQEFDAFVAIETGLKPLYIIENRENQGPVPHFVTATFMGSTGLRDYFATHQETRLYASSNQAPICFVAISGLSNLGQYFCQLSGFLVDVP